MDTPPSQGPSTLAQAEEIKKDQGSHECEVSVCTEATAAEADLHKHVISCKKNPGHKDFIPVKKFTMKHLPQRYPANAMLEFIKAMICLTVRVCVRYTSFDRPETHPNTGQPYPFYNHRGKKFGRMGSGMVWSVRNFTTDENKRYLGKEGETCPCEPCKHSPTPMTQWYEVIVHTAAHVVFDTAEAKHTTCQLFYDSEEEKNKIVELKGEVMEADVIIEHDVCLISCYTHDLVLGKRLEEMWCLYGYLSEKVNAKWKNCVIEHPLTVIVSHPHGCSKHVTVGEMKHREVVLEDVRNEMKVDLTNIAVWVYDFTRYTYTTPTCPGSSGAPVYVFGKDDELGWAQLHPHSAAGDGFNMSGIRIELKLFPSRPTTTCNIL